MRLISCYIENYGAISGKSFVFNEGITEQLLENGAGKSTLAAFLQAMLYGMESYRNNSKDFCDRLHYYPFAGGTYGGTLTFEHGGKEYKVERTFAEKSETADTLTVYAGGERTDELGTDIGRAVLGIDKESFRRTAFVGSDEIEISATSSISAKLSGFLQGMDEDAGFDRAIEALEKAAKVYQKRSKGSRIAETEDKLDELRFSIRNAEDTARALEQKYFEAERLKKEINGLLERQKEGLLRNEKLGEWEHYEHLLQRKSEAEEGLRSIEARYPLGLPSEGDTKEIRAVKESLEKEEAQLEKKTFSPADDARLEEYTRLFIVGVPNETEIAGIERKVEESARLKTEIDLKAGREHTNEERRLLQKFSAAAVTEEELVKAEEAAKACASVRSELTSIPETLTETERVASEKPNLKKYGVIAVAAALVALLGVGLFFLQNALGIAVGAVGAAALVLDGFLYLNKKSAVGSVERSVQVRNPKRDEKERELRGYEDTVRALVLQYGYSLEEGEQVAVYRMREDWKKYGALVKEGELCALALKEKTEELARCRQGIADFFAQYKLSAENPMKAISDLRGSIEEYAALSARKRRANEDDDRLKNSIEIANGRVRAYLQKYGLQSLELEKISEDLHAYNAAKEALKKAAEAAEAYYVAKSLTQKPSGEKEDTAGLSERVQELRKKEATLLKEIDEDERVVEKLDEYRGEWERQEELLKEYKQKHGLLTAAAKLLKDADKQLKDRYVKPIKDEFTFFAEPLEKAIGEKLVMTKDFEIRYDIHGKERSDKHLSAGQRSICALCFRLALIKNMYAGALPFLILDDPFVFLVEEHMARVKELLKELSKDFQMIYFTCHESRSLC